MTESLSGFHRLVELYNLHLVQPLFTRSRLGAGRQREVSAGQEISTQPAQYPPEDSFRGHFEFGLKYERLNFEFFPAVHRLQPDEIAAWVRKELTGSYARRTAFLYEWFTGQSLDVPDTASNVGYVNAIDAKLYLVAQAPTRDRRWPINNNLPGLPVFCPLTYLGAKDERQWIYDVAADVKARDDTYGAELLLRSAA